MRVECLFIPEVGVLEVEGVGGDGGGALDLALDGEVVALLGVGHHQHATWPQFKLKKGQIRI